MPKARRHRENWVKKANDYTKHMNDKETVEKLKENKELQDRIKKVKVL
jgi:hypothetical protein